MYQPPVPQQRPPVVIYTHTTRRPPVVIQQRMSEGAIIAHTLLTLFTCGLWAPVVFLHWLFTRNKQVVHY